MLFRIQGVFELRVQLLAYLVGQTVAEFREHLAVEDAPHHLVIYISLFKLAAQVLTAVLHIEEPEVGV